MGHVVSKSNPGFSLSKDLKKRSIKILTKNSQ